MVGVVGVEWDLEEDLTSIEWDSVSGIDDDKVEAIREALIADEGEDVSDPKWHFTRRKCYNGALLFGKNRCSPGTRTLAASRWPSWPAWRSSQTRSGRRTGRRPSGTRQETKIPRTLISQKNADEKKKHFPNQVRPVLESWLDGTNDDPLLYDTTWGGVVATDGIEDEQADFGQGYYNDHYFHYGYHIYTAAVLALADPGWADQYGDQVLHLIRDIAEPSGTDPYYTQVSPQKP